MFRALLFSVGILNAVNGALGDDHARGRSANYPLVHGRQIAPDIGAASSDSDSRKQIEILLSADSTSVEKTDALFNLRQYCDVDDEVLNAVLFTLRKEKDRAVRDEAYELLTNAPSATLNSKEVIDSLIELLEHPMDGSDRYRILSHVMFNSSRNHGLKVFRWRGYEPLYSTVTKLSKSGELSTGNPARIIKGILDQDDAAVNGLEKGDSAKDYRAPAVSVTPIQKPGVLSRLKDNLSRKDLAPSSSGPGNPLYDLNHPHSPYSPYNPLNPMSPFSPPTIRKRSRASFRPSHA